MPASRPKSFTISLEDMDRENLAQLSRSRSLPHALVRRAKIILLAGVGATNSEIAKQLDISLPTVTFWCRRYLAQGLAGLYD